MELCQKQALQAAGQTPGHYQHDKCTSALEDCPRRVGDTMRRRRLPYYPAAGGCCEACGARGIYFPSIKTMRQHRTAAHRMSVDSGHISSSSIRCRACRNVDTAFGNSQAGEHCGTTFSSRRARPCTVRQQMRTLQPLPGASSTTTGSGMPAIGPGRWKTKLVGRRIVTLQCFGRASGRKPYRLWK